MPYYTLNEVLTLSSPTVKNTLSLGHVATVTASQNVGVHLKLALFADGARGASPPLLDMGINPTVPAEGGTPLSRALRRRLAPCVFKGQPTAK